MKVEDVKKVGVVGAGTMGSGIAQVVASNGRDVILLDVSDSALDRGMKAIGNSLGRLVKKGDIKEEDSKSILSRIKTSTKFEDLADTDLVIEAVFEDLNVKKETFKKLDATTRPDIMLATNTSSLPIIEIAVITKRPDKVIGMHFFNPVPLMKLVEIIKSLATSEETVQFAYDFNVAGFFDIDPWTVLIRANGRSPLLIYITSKDTGATSVWRSWKTPQILNRREICYHR